MTRRSTTRPRLGARRLTLELLEDRTLLDATPGNVLAIFPGVLAPGATRDIPVVLRTTPNNFTLAGGTTILGVHIRSDGGGFDPDIAVVRQGGNAVTPLFQNANLAGSGDSLAVFDLGATNYTIQVRGQGTTSGNYRVEVFLAGDADGNGTVNATDGTLIRNAFGVRSPDARYNAAYDSNRDGIIEAFDLAQQRRNLNDATLVRPFVLSSGQPTSLLSGDSVIVTATATGAQVPLAYQWAFELVPPGSLPPLGDPSARTQVVRPPAAGDYVLKVVATDTFGQYRDSRFAFQVMATPPAPPTQVSVAAIHFTSEHEGVVDPTSAAQVAFEGPVDPATLTSDHVVLRRGTEALPSDLSFDGATRTLTVTPRAPLPLNASFTLEVRNIGATVAPFQFKPFTAAFLTPARTFALVGGTVFAPDRSPLAGVAVRIAGQETRTDAQGAFQFRDVAVGPQLLDVDPSGLPGPVVYTPMHYLLTVLPGPDVNTVGQPIVLTAVDTRTLITYPAQRVLTNPSLPGLTIDFTGVGLTNPDGTPYAGPLSLSPVVPTNVPMPFPGASSTFWTIQPGGLLASPRARITVPLPVRMDPGEQVELWAFDHGTNRWENYGMGRVNAGGLTATSLDGQGLPFTGWGSAVTRREVKRRIKGLVSDGDGNPLHGVQVQVGGGDSVYTDYDNGTRGFDGTVDGDFATMEVLVGYNRFVNGQFQAFEPSTVSLTILAQDILDGPFSANVTVNISGLSNTGTLDGGLPATIDRGAVTLSAYHVVDAAGDIHLHKDLADSAARSHTIRLNHPLATTARYQAEVRAVTKKLASQGFRQNNQGSPLTESATWTTAPIRAAKLFQTLVFANGHSGTFTTAAASDAGSSGSVDGRVGPGTLRRLNANDGVLWTRNGEDVQNQWPNGFVHRNNNNRWMHASIPEILSNLTDQFAAIPMLQGSLVSNSAATGGRQGVPQGRTHGAGSEVDFGWIDTRGNPQNTDFYEILPGRQQRFNQRAVRDAKGRFVMPNAEDELLPTTPADQMANKSWQMRSTYDRARTHAFIGAILAQPHGQVIFNDPQINGVSRVFGHHNHIHASFPYSGALLDPETDGAPSFNPSSASGTFAVSGVTPEPGEHAANPGAPLVVTLTRAVDPMTLTPQNLRLVNAVTLEEYPYSLVVGSAGTTLTLSPTQELPENASFNLLAGALLDVTGETLVTDSGGVVTSFSTTLSPDVTSARFDPQELRLTRTDLSTRRLRVLGTTSAGLERDLTGFAEDIRIVDEAGNFGTLVLDEAGNVTRVEAVGRGRGTMSVALDSGLSALGFIELDLVPPSTLVSGTVAGELVVLRFDEPVNGAGSSVVSAQAVEANGAVHGGTFTLSPDGRSLTFLPTQSLPTVVPLVLQVTLRLTDGSQNSVEVVTETALTVQEARRILLVADDLSDAVVVVDAATNVPIGAVTIGPGTIGDVAITRDGRLGFATDFNSRVWVLDLSGATPRLATGNNPIPIANPGEDLAFTADERFLIVSDGSVSSPLAVIDIAARQQVSTFSRNQDFNSVDVGSDGSVLTTSFNQRTVRRLMIDVTGTLRDTNEVLVSGSGPMNTYLAAGNRVGVMVNFSPGQILSFTAPGLQVVNVRPLASNGIAAALAPDGRRVYVRGTNTLQAMTLDPLTGQLGSAPLYTLNVALATPFFGMDQIAVSADGTRLYVAQAGSVTIHDAATGVLLATLTHPSLRAATGVAVSGSPRLALRAAGPAGDELPPSTVALTAEQARRLTRAAEAIWEAALRRTLPDFRVDVADLSGGALGLADVTAGRILIDRNAAGVGWFVDPTPFTDEEFVAGSAYQGSPASGRYDLLTTALHEIGHLLGFDHVGSQDHHDDVMNESLSVGERRLPARRDAIFPAFGGVSTVVLARTVDVGSGEGLVQLAIALPAGTLRPIDVALTSPRREESVVAPPPDSVVFVDESTTPTPLPIVERSAKGVEEKDVLDAFFAATPWDELEI